MAITIQQNTSTKSKRSRSATASIAGFEYQFEKMLHHLATSLPGASVGIETDDDISISQDGITSLEQDKFVVEANKNPFSNRSENLWKTLQIWIDYVAKLPSQDNFCFYFATNSAIKRKNGSLVWMISDVTDEESAKKCITALKKTKKSTTESLSQIMDYVKGCDYAILESVVMSAKVADQEKMDGTVLVKALEPPTGIDGSMLLNYMRGWLRSLVLNRWVTGNPGIVTRQEFVDAKDRHCETQKRYRKIERPWREIVVSEDDKANCVAKVFVEQIVEIKIMPEDIASDTIEFAIENYIRFFAENSHLLNEGEITDGEWSIFFDGLKNRWRTIRNKNTVVQQNVTREEIGRRTYHETLSPDYRESLAGQQTTELYLTHGGYHCLADEEFVYWHPDYKNVHKSKNNKQQ